MSDSTPQDDRGPADLPLTEKDERLFNALSEVDLQELDEALLANCAPYARKVARVVGTTMLSPTFRERGLPDYATRIVELVRQGKLIAEGNLNYMRYSEVRLA